MCHQHWCDAIAVSLAHGVVPRGYTEHHQLFVLTIENEKEERFPAYAYTIYTYIYTHTHTHARAHAHISFTSTFSYLVVDSRSRLCGHNGQCVEARSVDVGLSIYIHVRTVPKPKQAQRHLSPFACFFAL